MKKIILITFCLIITSRIIVAQSWQWSKKITPPIGSWYIKSGLITDKNGTIFSYGSNSINSPTDTTGSFLQSYSTNGVLLFSKRWKIPFHIQKMEYDGNNYFYFVAKFYGSQTIDGITIVSQGNADGVTGKMDLSGHIIWMNTFGGGGFDAANGICLNSADSSIYITGEIKDTLFFNNSFQSINAQSAIIGCYTSAGNLMNHKLYNFPSQNFAAKNSGVEINRNQAGDLYVLMDRNADKWWGNEPGTSALIGRYLFKLNSNLDTLWSKYINGPQSYYGWTCNNLRVAANGDAYLTNWSSSKYGGYGSLLRLSKNTGTVSWILANNDGLYRDVLIDSNTVYLIGEEGANKCPCEGSHPGYYVIKKIDENNNSIGETRISNAFLSHISKNALGNIFVTGYFWRSSVILGSDKVIADSTLSSYGNYYNYSGNFLSKLNDINCTVPIISVSVPEMHWQSYSLCPGDTAALTQNLTTGSFNWSNGNTGQQTNVSSTGYYSVSNTQPNGCIAYSLPVSIIVNQNINSHKICMVTYNDSVHKNTIAVRYDDYSYSGDIKQINLFKKDGNSIVPVSSITSGNITWGAVFTDQASNPDSVSVEYYISTIDTCNTVSNLSLVHQSIFLKVNPDLNSKNVLNWNAYVGMPVTGYRIWRGASVTSLVLYDSVDVSVTTYTDQSTSATHYFYQVQTINQWMGCYVNQTSYKFSRSNISNYDNSTVNIEQLSLHNVFTIYPNPTRGVFQINYSSLQKNNLELTIFNSKGEKVFSERVSKFNGEFKKEIDLSKEANGIYFLEIISNEKKEMKKIVLN